MSLVHGTSLQMQYYCTEESQQHSMQSMAHSTFVFKRHKADCTPLSLLECLISHQHFVV